MNWNVCKLFYVLTSICQIYDGTIPISVNSKIAQVYGMCSNDLFWPCSVKLMEFPCQIHSTISCVYFVKAFSIKVRTSKQSTCYQVE